MTVCLFPLNRRGTEQCARFVMAICIASGPPLVSRYFFFWFVVEFEESFV